MATALKATAIKFKLHSSTSHAFNKQPAMSKGHAPRAARMYRFSCGFTRLRGEARYRSQSPISRTRKWSSARQQRVAGSVGTRDINKREWQSWTCWLVMHVYCWISTRVKAEEDKRGIHTATGMTSWMVNAFRTCYGWWEPPTHTSGILTWLCCRFSKL